MAVLLLYSRFICGVLLLQGIPQQKNDSDCGVFVLEVRPPILTAVLLSTHSSLLLSHLQLWGIKKKRKSRASSVFPSSSFDTILIFAHASSVRKDTGERLLPMSICNMSIQSCSWISLFLTSDLCLVLSVLPLPLREAAAAVQSGGYASHPQEDLQGAV